MIIGRLPHGMIYKTCAFSVVSSLPNKVCNYRDSPVIAMLSEISQEVLKYI